MADSTEQFIKVISSPTDKRVQEDIDSVLPWIRRRAQILRNIDTSDLTEIITVCQHQTVSKDDIIIQQGEQADCMFIILRGSTLAYMDTAPMGDEDIRISPTTTAKLTRGVVVVPAETKRRNKLPERMNSGKFIMRYCTGNSFGEQSLLTEDKSRKATIVAEEDCDLMVIGQQVFDKILRNEQQREYDQMCLFIEYHPYFAHLSYRFKPLLELSLRKETFPFDGTIVRQGKQVTSLHFLLEGQANMYVEPIAYQRQYAKLWPFEAGIDLYCQEFEYLRKSRRAAILKKYEDPGALPIKSDHFIKRRTEGYAAAEKMVQERSVCLCTVHGGEVIGDLEIIQNLGTYLSTIICTAPTTAFVLDICNLERFLGKRNPITMEVMKRQAKEKLQRRANSSLGRGIAFLNYLLFKLTDESLPLSEKKKLSPIKPSKFLPEKDIQMQHLLERFKDGQAQLIEPCVPGALIYKEQMQEKARVRARFRNRGPNEISARLRETRQRIAGRQPRSRREIVKFLKESMDTKVADYTRGYVDTSNGAQSRNKKQTQPKILMDDHQSSKLVECGFKHVCFKDQDNNGMIDKVTVQNLEVDDTPNGEFVALSASNGDYKNETYNSQIEDINTCLPLTAGTSDVEPIELFNLNPTKDMLLDVVDNTGQNLNTCVDVIPSMEDEQHTNNSIPFSSEYQENEASEMSPSVLKLPSLNKLDMKQEEKVSSSKWEPAMKLVNNRITDRFTSHLLSHETEFDDYETSDKNLEILENRIKTFFTRNIESRYLSDNSELILPKLRRFKVDQDDPEVAQPKPGGRVWIRKRMCRFANNTLSVTDHDHINHHIVAELPEFANVQKSKVILRYLLSGALPGNVTPVQS